MCLNRSDPIIKIHIIILLFATAKRHRGSRVFVKHPRQNIGNRISPLHLLSHWNHTHFATLPKSVEYHTLALSKLGTEAQLGNFQLLFPSHRGKHPDIRPILHRYKCIGKGELEIIMGVNPNTLYWANDV